MSFFRYEFGVRGQGGAYAFVKFDDSKPNAHVKPSSGKIEWEGTNQTYYYGDYYSFAIRGATDTSKGASYQAYVFDYKAIAIAFSWYGAKHYEYLYHENCVHLSKHYYDWPPSEFPTSTGLDPYLDHFVQMEVGTLAHYSGIYNGPDIIRIIAPGGVRDLGRPVHSGITIRITVRKTLDNFSFFADYGTEPSVAKYQDLVVSGHEYVPHFSMNFNIRHVYLEVYC
ncbi:hypothetical protein MTO96_038934 [Rhipicephalus appendiculatus]